MRFIINTDAERVIAATGQRFEGFNLTPERVDLLLQTIDAAGGQASTGQLAQVLACNIPDAARLLGELSDRGSVRAIMTLNRPRWERRSLDLNSGLVREEHVPHILAFLVGRRELPGRIADELGLPRDEIAETCKFMMVGGQLVGTHIGASTIYALDIRGTTRVDVEAAARVAPSPQARFLAELAALPPVKLPPRPVLAPERKVAIRKAKPVRKPAERQQVVKKVRPVKVATPRVKAVKPEKKAARVAVLKVKPPKPVRKARKVPTPRVKAVKPEKKAVAKKPVRVPKVKPEKRQRVSKKTSPRPQPAPEVFPEGTVQANHAARSLGVKSVTFYRWLNMHSEARALCVKGRKLLMVPPQVLEMYKASCVPNGATFATAVPEGWLDIWQTVDALGWSYSKVYGMLDAGRLSAVQADGKLRFDPATVQTLKAALDAEEAVPEGWTNLRLLAAEMGLHISSVVAWMRRRKYETRKYRDAERQLVLFVPDAAATEYREARLVFPGGNKLTPEMREAIRNELPPLPPGQRRPASQVQAVAARYGVTVSRVQQLVGGKAGPASLGQAAD